MKRGTVSAFAAALLAAPCLAVYGIHTNPGSSDSFFQWVGQVGGASGSVVAPNWVLTARHVSGNFTLGGNTYIPDQRIESPTADLALLHFSETFGGHYSLYGGSAVGHEVSMVGYGLAAYPRTDHLGFTLAQQGGTRRVATNVAGISEEVQLNIGGGVVLTFQALLADLDTTNPNTPAGYNRDWFGDGTATSDEGGLMYGDSGGGWFLNDGGEWKLVGVNDFIFSADDQPPGFSGNDQYMVYGYSGSGAVDLTWGPQRDWVLATIVPEPASMLALAAGLAAIGARRRRR